MSIWYLYFLLPVILFPTVSVINVLFWRKIGARKLSLYRQATVTIIGFPILFSLLLEYELLIEHSFMIILCWVLGASYLTIAFYAMNLTSIWISRSFVAVSRTLSAFALWFFIFQESISLYDFFGIFIIFLWIYALWKSSGEKIQQKDLIWIWCSLLWWIIFSFNTLVFKILTETFWSIESAYLLEASSFIPLLILYTFSKKQNHSTSIAQDYKKIGVLFITAPLILLASYGLAVSVTLIPFYIINTLFILVLIVSMILSWIFLWEKFKLSQLLSIAIMMLWCLGVVLF